MILRLAYNRCASNDERRYGGDLCALWVRTGSTYLWSRLRNDPRALAYYEVFNEDLRTLTEGKLLTVGPETWQSGHPPSAPYFLEYAQLLADEGGVAGFDETMSYDRFLPVDGCRGNVTDQELSYLNGLATYAVQHDRIPVLTACRSLGRVRGLKAGCPGFHVLIYRNLFQQWSSCTDLAFHNITHFIDVPRRISAAFHQDSVINHIKWLFPVKSSSCYDPNTFYLFVFFHLHLYVQAVAAVDLVVDINRLACDASYRAQTERDFFKQGLAVDLSRARNSVKYSLCDLGDVDEVEARLRSIGSLILNEAPEAAGMAFGTKLLDDLIREYRRHEFETKSIRRIVIELQSAKIDYIQLARQSNKLEAELRITRAELDLRRKSIYRELPRIVDEAVAGQALPELAGTISPVSDPSLSPEISPSSQLGALTILQSGSPSPELTLSDDRPVLAS